MKHNEIRKFEKTNMNKIRYTINYLIVPLYVLFSIICGTVAGILLEIDEIQHTPIAIGLFVFLGIISVLLLATIPFVRKIEIRIEMDRYDFDVSKTESKRVYDFSDDSGVLNFNRDGMYLNGKLFWYNHLGITIDTSNYLNRVWIKIVFFINDNAYCQVPLNRDTLNMIKNFDIPLENRVVLDYIVHNKKEAFTKIYKTGHA